MSQIITYIALGSNLGDSQQHVLSACERLSCADGLVLLARSSLYQNPALTAGQPEYTNAIVKLACTLAPFALLTLLQQIEQDHGRMRTGHWSARTLDLDIVLYGNAVIQTSRLTIPHPEMRNRSFVLQPLAEVAPDLIMPTDHVPLQELLQYCRLG